MAAQSGKTIVISIKDDAGTPAYQVLAGLRARAIKLGAETVDVTNADSTGAWRELLGGVGVRSATMSGDGVFTDDAGWEAARDAFFDHRVVDAKIAVTGMGTFQANWIITELSSSADYNGAVAYSMTLESAGAIAWTLT